MRLQIRHYPDPVLAQETEQVEVVDSRIRQLADDMLETMYADNGIGLAAPQVGELCRLIVVDITGNELRAEPRILLNPEIVTREGETEYEEGCLSVPNFRTLITRAEAITVAAQDLDGRDVKIEADGLLAICLQHEIDHLNGRIILDHASRLKKTLYEKKVRKWQHRQAADAV